MKRRISFRLQACFILITVTLVTVNCAEQRDWDRYLDDRYYYISHFSETLRRKSDSYAGKRDEYTNWLVNYRETEREDRRTHGENDDERIEQQHEIHETEREHHHEHDNNVRRQMVDRMTMRLMKRKENVNEKKSVKIDQSENENPAKMSTNVLLGVLSHLTTVAMVALLVFLIGPSPSLGHHEHFRSYLEHRDFYMTHFNEMLNRKNDVYQSKHHEYSDRLNTYDHMNHEDQRHHDEADDEQMEANHENHEVQHESSHHQGDHAKRTRIIIQHKRQRELKDIVRTPKKAIQFIRNDKLPKRLRRKTN